MKEKKPLTIISPFTEEQLSSIRKAVSDYMVSLGAETQGLEKRKDALPEKVTEVSEYEKEKDIRS